MDKEKIVELIRALMQKRKDQDPRAPKKFVYTGGVYYFKPGVEGTKKTAEVLPARTMDRKTFESMRKLREWQAAEVVRQRKR